MAFRVGMALSDSACRWLFASECMIPKSPPTGTSGIRWSELEKPHPLRRPQRCAQLAHLIQVNRAITPVLPLPRRAMHLAYATRRQQRFHVRTANPAASENRNAAPSLCVEPGEHCSAGHGVVRPAAGQHTHNSRIAEFFQRIGKIGCAIKCSMEHKAPRRGSRKLVQQRAIDRAVRPQCTDHERLRPCSAKLGR